MQLYFSPLSCSASVRICLYEAGVPAVFTQVDPRTKRTLDGADYRQVHALGTVPALRTDDGEVLTENAAILQYVADTFPQAKLAPEGTRERVRLRQWLSFVGTELHKALFTPLLDKAAPEAAKAYVLEKGASRLAFLEAHLTGREFLLEHFSVADAYLATVLNWSAATPVKLDAYPAVHAYHARLLKRPSVAKALSEERRLYVAEQERYARGA
jgi:glutathione S-transferase